VSAYKVSYTRDTDGMWVAQVKEIPACHTQGKSLRQARSRIREALSLYAADARTANFRETVVVPKALQVALDRAKVQRENLKQASARSTRSLREAVAKLQGKGFSLRDIGELLGVSYQRVSQLVND